MLLVSVVLGSATPAPAQTASLALSAGAAPPGGSITTNLTFHANGTKVTGIQWTLNYSPSDFRAVSIAGTETAAAAGELLTCDTQPDHINCLMINLTSSTVIIPDGVVAVVTFNLASGTKDTSSAISLTNLTATNGSGSALKLTGAGATITINQPAVVSAPSGVASVNAASFFPGSVAPDSIATAFGARLATATQAATKLPLPTALDGTTVKVRDAAGTERLAPLFYVSSSQVNYDVPAGTAIGTATVTITAGDNTATKGPLNVVHVAPGIFTLNRNALVAANVLRVRSGKHSYEPVFQIDQTTHQVLALPVDLGPSTDQVYLLIYGTGIRGRSKLSAVSVNIGGVAAQVTYAGPQGYYQGLDQVNVLLPRSLVGRGSVDVVLMADGNAANLVRVTMK